MPRTEEQFEEIRENRRQQIMDTALQLFANEGYYTTSISKIAKKARISKGLMYNYFISKDELIRAIVHAGFERIMSTFDTNRDGILTEEEMAFFLEENFRVIRDNFPYWKLYYSIISQPAVQRLAMEQLKEFLPELMKVMTDFFRQRGVVDPEMEALYFGALMDGIAFNFIMNPDEYPLDKMKEFLLKKLNKETKNNAKK
jgi:AcrR family transcriptional regulator